MNVSINEAYDSGWYDGFEKGRDVGYTTGYQDAEQDFEVRVKKLYAELLELNARIAVLEARV